MAYTGIRYTAVHSLRWRAALSTIVFFFELWKRFTPIFTCRACAHLQWKQKRHQEMFQHGKNVEWWKQQKKKFWNKKISKTWYTHTVAVSCSYPLCNPNHCSNITVVECKMCHINIFSASRCNKSGFLNCSLGCFFIHSS